MVFLELCVFALFGSCFLCSLQLLQSVKAAFERPGLEKDFRAIAEITAADFAEAVDELQEQTNKDEDQERDDTNDVDGQEGDPGDDKDVDENGIVTINGWIQEEWHDW